MKHHDQNRFMADRVYFWLTVSEGSESIGGVGVGGAMAMAAGPQS